MEKTVPRDSTARVFVISRLATARQPMVQGTSTAILVPSSIWIPLLKRTTKIGKNSNWTSWQTWCDYGTESHLWLRSLAGGRLCGGGGPLCLARISSVGAIRLVLGPPVKGSYLLLIELP